MRNIAAADQVWHPVSRVLLWDEAAPARSIVPVVNRAFPAACVEMVTDVRDLVQRCHTTPPDLVFVAVRARGGTGAAVVERLHRDCRTVPIVAVGTRSDAAAMAEAVTAGARGLAILDAEGAALAETGSNGGTIGASNGTPVRTMPRSLARTPNALTVTERELQILRGMTDGCSNLEIAKQLFVSEDTVKTHARRLFRKLGAHDRAHAVALGMRYELVA